MEVPRGCSVFESSVTPGLLQHVETLGFDLDKSLREMGQCGVKNRQRMCGQRVTQGGHPALHVFGKKFLLPRQVAGLFQPLLGGLEGPL